MGPYPLSDTNLLADGEMGPYPLSDNTNLLSTGSMGIPLHRNYGSNYGSNYETNYTSSSCTYYTRAQYGDNQQCANNYGNNYNSYGRSTNMQCNYAVDHGTKSKSKSKTPVPTRKYSVKKERDSFRRHSAHGRVSNQGIIG